MFDRSRTARGVLLSALAMLLASPTMPACFGESCRNLEDAEAPTDEVTITLRNDTDEVLFVDAGEGCSAATFTLTRGGEIKPWRRPTCGFSCEGVMDGDCSCSEECGTGSLLRLEPGASRTTRWGLTIYVDENISLDCPADGCPTKCSRLEAAIDGTYSVSAAAGSECDDTTGECECEADDDACVLEARLLGEPSMTARASVVLPEDLGETIVLAFQ